MYRSTRELEERLLTKRDGDRLAQHALQLNDLSLHEVSSRSGKVSDVTWSD